MQWLNKIVDEIVKSLPSGEILIESGGSPSGTYHLGHMRELVTADAILLELKRRGRQAKHIYFVDDLDVFRKIPVNVPDDFDQYLGKPLCDVPSPDGKEATSYADYFLNGLIESCKALSVDVEFVRSHPKYRSGFFVPAIERSLERLDKVRAALETISGRKLEKEWSPIQVNEEGYLKKRPFVSLDKDAKTIRYIDKDGKEQTTSYAKGEVKLDWRLDWPARWWLLKVHVEPYGREHASAGGSYDTGVQLMKDVYEADPPIPVPYDSINMVGDTKKMSASKGTAISALEGIEIMPTEVVRFFILRAPLERRLYFDPVNGVVQLMDEFAEIAAKTDKSKSEQQLFDICMRDQSQQTVSNVPFSHLVASYQASLRDADKTLEIIERTEHKELALGQSDIIRRELKFIDAWLDTQAPEDIKFELADKVDVSKFNDKQLKFLNELADRVEQAPKDADGEWYHKAIYDLKDSTGLEPKQLFQTLYQVLIGKDSGPRAGWFLSILPRDWLLKRLRLEK
ncbi:MAG TPA: lysine--tRNA ligase [Candidatus Saccharimonadales bacterium]|nr:lysine--tRNA ligase [Candidatus Saccharimonadales bacterium]